MRTQTLCVIVATGFVDIRDKRGLFLPTDDVVTVPLRTTLIDLLCDGPIDSLFPPHRGLPVFTSRSQAKKNLQGRVEIPWGWSSFKFGKFRHELFIWKPSSLES